MAAASLVSGICAILGGYACAALSARVGQDMRVAVYDKSLKLSVYDFRQFGTASITTRTISDITNIQMALTSFIQMVLPVPVIIVLAVILTFNLDVQFGLVLLCAVAAVLICLVHHAQRISAVSKAAEAVGPHEQDPAGKHHRCACSARLQQ